MHIRNTPKPLTFFFWKSICLILILGLNVCVRCWYKGRFFRSKKRTTKQYFCSPLPLGSLNKWLYFLPFLLVETLNLFIRLWTSWYWRILIWSLICVESGVEISNSELIDCGTFVVQFSTSETHGSIYDIFLFLLFVYNVTFSPEICPQHPVWGCRGIL